MELFGDYRRLIDDDQDGEYRTDMDMRNQIYFLTFFVSFLHTLIFVVIRKSIQ